MRLSFSLATVLGLVAQFAGAETRAAPPDYGRDLLPLLKEHCTKCHGGVKQKGGLDLRSLERALAGGESGPAFVPGKPEASRLASYLHRDADPHMPPKGQLGAEEIRTIRDWITNFRAGEQAPPNHHRSPAESLPPGLSPHLAIDVLLEESWQEKKVRPAPGIDDATFVRRLSLDLLGRIPTRDERTAFLAATDSGKRERLIDELLASRGHARSMAEVFNVVLLEREEEKGKSRGEREQHLLPYLRWVFETNRPWNKVGRDLIVARPGAPEERGASWFLYEQGDDADKMATATSRALFGKQVQCAQCHDHPVAPEIEQRHYWGLVSFFERTRNVTTKEGPGLGERAAGGYAKFANLEGESSESELVFFTGAKVDEPGGRRDKDALENYLTAPPQDWINPPKPKKKGAKPKITRNVDRAPTPKFSRREALARLGLEENPDFARAFVNRAWALFLGRGMVHPVDKMTSAHPPSHPALLDWLAQDFAASDYNVRRLFRAILTSRAYALSAAHPAEVRPLPETFAYSLDKPLSAEALSRSMLVALGAKVGEDGTVAGEQEYRAAFVHAYPDLFAEVFSPSVQQAMFATNGPAIDGMLRKADLPLPVALDKNPDNEEAVHGVFLNVLGREPTSAERERGLAYLTERSDRRPDAIRQLIWALFQGAEFRMNH